MNAMISSPSLTTFASTVLIGAGVMLSACDHRVSADPAQGLSAALPMSTLAAMGPVYFGDIMSFGENPISESLLLVAVNKP